MTIVRIILARRFLITKKIANERNATIETPNTTPMVSPRPSSLLLSLVVCSSDETLLPCESASILLDVFEGEGEGESDGEEGEFFGGLL